MFSTQFVVGCCGNDVETPLLIVRTDLELLDDANGHWNISNIASASIADLMARATCNDAKYLSQNRGTKNKSHKTVHELKS